MWDWLKSPKTPTVKQELENHPTMASPVETPEEKIIIITGMSGSGRKSTAKQLSLSLGIPYVSSYTTRTIRPQERDGEHYHFISDDEFQAMLERK